jgi:hypothetical protein
LDADELQKAFADFEQRFLAGVSLMTADGALIDLTVTALEVPEAADLALARHSEVTLEGRWPDGAEALVWSYEGRFGRA